MRPERRPGAKFKEPLTLRGVQVGSFLGGDVGNSGNIHCLDRDGFF